MKTPHCPRCGQAFVAKPQDTYHCQACQKTFPNYLCVPFDQDIGQFFTDTSAICKSIQRLELGYLQSLAVQAIVDHGKLQRMDGIKLAIHYLQMLVEMEEAK